ncbi:hypothetical protein M514_15954 [Trichuris suis]|uniref:Uncharacterized protein n=1 Tax=Trichuris suis TaxID=68888 RepID=A0A085NQU8_9BILA|nr:hypothetical protein M514_15954 [Trichuris suis]
MDSGQTVKHKRFLQGESDQYERSTASSSNFCWSSYETVLFPFLYQTAPRFDEREATLASHNQIGIVSSVDRTVIHLDVQIFAYCGHRNDSLKTARIDMAVFCFLFPATHHTIVLGVIISYFLFLLVLQQAAESLAVTEPAMTYRTALNDLTPPGIITKEGRS